MAQSKERHAEYMIERYHRLRNEWIEAQGGVCKICGSSVELEIDHIDPKLKELSLGKMWSVSKKRREAELLKCQVLCKECHLEKTIAENEFKVAHGGGVSGRHKCKCDLCRLKKNEYLKNLKRERRARGLKD